MLPDQALQLPRGDDDDPFPMEEKLDGEDSEEEEDVEQVAARDGQFIAISGTALDDDEHCLQYDFIPRFGGRHNAVPVQSLSEKYGHMSETDIVLSLTMPLLTTLRDCSNTVDGLNITMRDLLLYHAFLTLRTLVPMDRNQYFWRPVHNLFSWQHEAEELRNVRL